MKLITAMVLSTGLVMSVTAQPTTRAPDAPPPTTPATPAAAPPAAAAAPAADEQFKQEELGQMLAPIALYPDTLLSQILMAATYPLEIVEADRWVKANPKLTGDPAAKALEAKEWDPSVKSLVNFPEVLAMLSEKLDWTNKLGDAFLAQRTQVMQTIQELRGKAKDAGQLKTTEQQTVIVEQGETQIIRIEPAEPTVIYVPTYDSTVVYGGWPYPSYPPYPYYPPGYYYPTGGLLAFGAGVACGMAWGYAWGNCNWGGNDIDIDIDRNTNINNNIDRASHRDKSGDRGKGSFKHDASHRKGVGYKDSASAKKYGGTTKGSATQARQDYRGKSATPSSRSGSGSRPTSTPATRPSGSTPSRGTTTKSPALQGAGSSGTKAKQQSSRGNTSRGTTSTSSRSTSSGSRSSGSSSGSRSSGGSRSGGGGGGGSRGGGGGGGRR